MTGTEGARQALKMLPEDYVGERHVVIVKREPTGASGTFEWCEFEERPGNYIARVFDFTIAAWYRRVGYLQREDTKQPMNRLRTLSLSLLLAVAAAGFAAAPNKPKSVIHVITIQWKAGATQNQIQNAIRAAENINYPGLKNVWTKPIKMQLPEGYKHIIVMEFESEEALNKYAESPAQKKWYEVYMPIREESRTHDITN
jgi:Stress responsive A/B Barrel Domain